MKNFYYLLLPILIFFTSPSLAQINIADAYPNLSFNSPIDLQFTSSSDSRIFAAERGGRIVVFENNPDVNGSQVFLDISERVNTAGEGGFLGFTFHPDYADSGYFYVYYTTGEDDAFRSIISRFEVSGANPDSAVEDSEEILLEVDQPYTNHNAGQIRFGPDEYLYIALGDGGSAGDPEGNGEDRTTLLGSLLRIDVDTTDGELNYGIPDDNPFVGNEEGYREEIYAYGLRNPYRFSFDAETVELWVADVGQNSLEEINIVESGNNYGWNTMEGSQCFAPETGCDTSGRELPIFEYGRDQGQSITGGFVYRGSKVPELEGRYVYADFGSGRIWSLAWDGEEATDNQLIDNFDGNQIITFGEDQNGELYFGAFDGNIYTFESDPVSAEAEENLPNAVRLEQNYPNPFNPTTEITFRLPEASDVELRVFDILGQEIALLFDGVKSRGEHSVRFDASNLSGGIYIYALRTGSTYITRKMTLLK
ncbi:MAG: PQQ-dependent sugar dehydrogenase [Balneolaceae bacterium]